MKQDGIGGETNHKKLLISQNKLRVAGGRYGEGMEVWVWRRWLGYGHWGGYVI